MVLFCNSLKHLVLIGARNSRINLGLSKRLIMTSQIRLEKAVEELKTNPYYDKYAEKIAKLQQTSPDEFLQRIAAKEAEIKQKEKKKRGRSFQQAPDAKSSQTVLQCNTRKLNDIMKLDLIMDKTKEEITSIWTEYHKQKSCIGAVMTADQYKKMMERGEKYATFLLPLPRDSGYEFIVIQFHGSEVHMTPLLWYQTHKENAPECLTLYHFTELMEDKGIVLMRGEFDTNAINVQEAQCLANELQLYYALDDVKRLNLLDCFMYRPDEFKHMDLIAQLEYISLATKSSTNEKKN